MKAHGFGKVADRSLLQEENLHLDLISSNHPSWAELRAAMFIQYICWRALHTYKAIYSSTMVLRGPTHCGGEKIAPYLFHQLGDLLNLQNPKKCFGLSQFSDHGMFVKHVWHEHEAHHIEDLTWNK